MQILSAPVWIGERSEMEIACSRRRQFSPSPFNFSTYFRFVSYGRRDRPLHHIVWWQSGFYCCVASWLRYHFAIRRRRDGEKFCVFLRLHVCFLRVYKRCLCEIKKRQLIPFTIIGNLRYQMPCIYSDIYMLIIWYVYEDEIPTSNSQEQI